MRSQVGHTRPSQTQKGGQYCGGAEGEIRWNTSRPAPSGRFTALLAGSGTPGGIRTHDPRFRSAKPSLMFYAVRYVARTPRPALGHHSVSVVTFGAAALC